MIIATLKREISYYIISLRKKRVKYLCNYPTRWDNRF